MPTDRSDNDALIYTAGATTGRWTTSTGVGVGNRLRARPQPVRATRVDPNSYVRYNPNTFSIDIEAATPAGSVDVGTPIDIDWSDDDAVEASEAPSTITASTEFMDALHETISSSSGGPSPSYGLHRSDDARRAVTLT